MTVALAIAFVPSLFAFDLEGKVKVEPPYPEPSLLPVDEKYVADCGPHKISSRLKISPDGGVANAVVQLEGDFSTLREMPLQGDFVLDQIDCEFKPHLALVPQGAAVSILNSDGFLHNVRAFDEKAEMLFNDAMPKKGQVLKKRFDRPGRIIVRCGLHHWMHAFVIVQEHPFYAVTNEKGYFKISSIPQGTYTLRVWHEELGEAEKEINSQTNSLILTYSSRR